MKIKTKIKVRSTHIDVMGHVNNAKFLEYMEWGREEWYNRLGVDFPALEKRGIGTVVVNIDIDYLKEASQDDILTIITEPLRRGNKSYVLLHKIYNQNEKMIVKAEVTSLIINFEDRTSVDMISEIADCYNNIT